MNRNIEQLERAPPHTIWRGRGASRGTRAKHWKYQYFNFWSLIKKYHWRSGPFPNYFFRGFGDGCFDDGQGNRCKILDFQRKSNGIRGQSSIFKAIQGNRRKIIDKSINALSLGYQFQVVKSLEFLTSLSRLPGNTMLASGIVWSPGPVQLHVLVDNIMFANVFDSKNFFFQFGLNFHFGRGKSRS